jgi:hypothetical protein
MPVTDHPRQAFANPAQAGVYLHKDRFGSVIYVGKARDLRKRVSQYFHPSRRLGWDLKFNALVDAIHDFDWHVVKSEPESLLLEGKLIKEFTPRFNIDFRDDKRFLLLKVNLNDPIPASRLPGSSRTTARSTSVRSPIRVPSAAPSRSSGVASISAAAGRCSPPNRTTATASTPTSSTAPRPASAM